MKRLISCLLLSLLVTSCAPRYKEYFAYTDEGFEKPKVAILPVLNSSKAVLNSDISDEIIFGLRNSICSMDKLFPLPQSDVNAAAALIGDAHYFTPDVSPWKGFLNAHYAIVMEVSQHKIVPFEKGAFSNLYPTNGGHSNQVLAIKVRLRILDVKYNQAKLVLDEIVESNHMMPWGFDQAVNKECSFDSPYYANTPFGMAHNRLIWQLSSRIHQVIGDCRY
jgi:hypothetical protein